MSQPVPLLTLARIRTFSVGSRASSATVRLVIFDNIFDAVELILRRKSSVNFQLSQPNRRVGTTDAPLNMHTPFKFFSYPVMRTHVQATGTPRLLRGEETRKGTTGGREGAGESTIFSNSTTLCEHRIENAIEDNGKNHCG